MHKIMNNFNSIPEKEIKPMFPEAKDKAEAVRQIKLLSDKIEKTLSKSDPYVVLEIQTIRSYMLRFNISENELNNKYGKEGWFNMK